MTTNGAVSSEFFQSDGASRPPQKPSSRLYLPQLDTMRFFAFLMVFFYHGLPANDMSLRVGSGRILALIEVTVHRSGENGVALFYLLSAFLISEILQREKDVSSTVHLKMFYIRRALRIWPLYYLAIAIGLALSVLFVQIRLSPRDILTYVFFLKNWDVVLHGWNWNPIFILWTVSSEEQFYLVWPLAQKFLNKRAMYWLCGVALLVIPAITFWPTGILMRNHQTEMLYLFMYFPIGGILSFALDGRRTPLSLPRAAGLLVLGLLLWFAGIFIAFPTGVDGPLAMLITGKMVIVVGTVLIFFAFLKSDPSWSFRPLAYLGKISYGLYVYHVMVLVGVAALMAKMGLASAGAHTLRGLILTLGVRLPVSLLLTIGVAAASYRFFEKRFLQLKDRFAVIHSRAA